MLHELGSALSVNDGVKVIKRRNELMDGLWRSVKNLFACREGAQLHVGVHIGIALRSAMYNCIMYLFILYTIVCVQVSRIYYSVQQE
jgi:hypothetical protein